MQWNREFLDWLVHSEFGIEENQRLNNHGSFALLHVAAIALFVGDENRATTYVETAKSCIESSITADGSQPLELARTRSWHYSCYNLTALTRLAAIGSKIGIELWDYTGSEGQILHRAIEYLIPAATDSTDWQHPEIEFLPYLASDIISASAAAGSAVAKVTEGQLHSPPVDLWSLRLSPDDLDSFV